MHSHKPIRTCIGCSRKAVKDSLLRLVRLPDGSIEPDKQGDKSGRGAYLCYKQTCFSTALKRQAIRRCLGAEPSHNFLEAVERILNVKN